MNSHPTTHKRVRIGGLAAAAILVTVIGIYFRLYPLIHYASLEASEKASLLTVADMRKSALQEVDQQYPQATRSELLILLRRPRGQG